MDIKIQYCNNIKEGEISVHEDELNIKFGLNGIGKSTISQAIQNAVADDGSLEQLKSLCEFDEINNADFIPKVSGLDSINSVKVFNQEYISQFLFQADELVSGSFNIFIKTSEYDKHLETIDAILSKVTDGFRTDDELVQMIDDLSEFSAFFRRTASSIAKNAKGLKSLVNGNKRSNIPTLLKPYSIFINAIDEKFKQWVGWHGQGQELMTISNDARCPFCASVIDDDRVNMIKSVNKEYPNNTDIKNQIDLINLIDKLSGCFSHIVLERLKEITKRDGGINSDDKEFLCQKVQQINDLLAKINYIQSLSFQHLQNFNQVDDAINQGKIDTALFTDLVSDEVSNKISKINSRLDEILKKSGELQGGVQIQKDYIINLIEEKEEEINDFFKIAGYKYRVSILEDYAEYKLKLQHIDAKQTTLNGTRHLSFGEKNAFALILFMHHVLSEKPDLIILDDPVSSFDNNKKYAIMEVLFRKERNFRGKTVLMFTHDMEPIIDFIKTPLFAQYNANAYYLDSRKGKLTEKQIERDDIKPFPVICKEILDSNISDIIKLIYLRRLYEITQNDGDAYQVVSNLLHKESKATATDHRVGKDAPLDAKLFENGVTEITETIPSFGYDKTLADLQDLSVIKELYEECNNDMEKLQLFRIVTGEGDFPDNVVKKFVNESYHTENEFIYQLDPNKFDLVPEFIAQECDNHVSQI